MNTLLSILIFVVVLGFMVLIHELGHFLLAKRAGIRVEEFGIGFPPKVAGFRRGETEYTLNALPLGGFVRMTGEDDPTDPRSFARAPKRWRVAVLVAGSCMNLLAAGLIFSLAFASGWPTPSSYTVGVRSVTDGSPAQAGGLRAGDVITTANGTPVTSPDVLRDVLRASAGQPVQLGVRRGAENVTLPVTPRQDTGQGAIGVQLDLTPQNIQPKQYPPLEALQRGFSYVAGVVALTFDVPRLALQGAIDPGLARPVGPVGIFQITQEATERTSASGSLWYLLQVAGTLGAGLGIANLLPIPGLDGGRLLFIIIEAIRGRRVAPEREGLFHLAGFVFLIGLVLIISFFDITHPITNSDFGGP